ncbi:hypothetical protein TNCV_1120721 [Trichonephila clavipes]|uniref:Uncharacterized protein n=1 Tax=Trichonephila clavipes TaxID=2585209 RepID=A0A8X6T7T5_TRICX|nr:hypothetical protein TNCV_1120721 [Trichonephila clavipes]
MDGNEDDTEELIMGHEVELTTELQEHQETQRNVSPSEQQEDERGPMPISAIKDLLKSGRIVYKSSAKICLKEPGATIHLLVNPFERQKCKCMIPTRERDESAHQETGLTKKRK